MGKEEDEEAVVAQRGTTPTASSFWGKQDLFIQSCELDFIPSLQWWETLYLFFVLSRSTINTKTKQRAVQQEQPRRSLVK